MLLPPFRCRTAFFFTLLISASVVCSARAQSGSQPPAQQSPASTPPQAPDTQAPAQTPSSATSPNYHDPLEQPIVVAPGAPGAQTTPGAQGSPTPAPVMTGVPSVVPVGPIAAPLAGTTAPNAVASLPDYYDPFDAQERQHDSLGSTYIPVDSNIYNMAMRLYSLGFLNKAFISMRPWTRRSLLHLLQESTPFIMNEGGEEAQETLAKLNEELSVETPGTDFARGRVSGLESVYTRVMGIGGQTLRDSYHLGQTINNDYGRPYQSGFNNVTGFSSVNEWGRFSLFVRGEYQHAPMGNGGYSFALASYLSCQDFICPFSGYNQPQDTIPYNNLGAQNPFRLQEASLSFHLLGHEISGGKTDSWLGPGKGGAFGWSNNAENIYSFRINRIEPLRIPLISNVLGPLRYDFYVGSLKGHTSPNSPWVHSEMFAFRPTDNFEFGFQRTVIWGGKNHEPVTIHTFLRSFFDINDTTTEEKLSALDPGARFSAFNFSWRLPYIRKYATLYVDSEAHDDVTPFSAPRRAAYRPGIVLSQLPHLPRMELRVEAADTDPPVTRSMQGSFNYFEAVQNQGYTNKGFIMGDWIGREAKGGQAWLTYHLSGNEWIQVEYLNKKTPKDFVPLGTTQNQFKIEVVKRLRKDIELDAWYQFERWKAPVYRPGSTTTNVIAGQITFYPKLKTSPTPRY